MSAGLLWCLGLGLLLVAGTTAGVSWWPRRSSLQWRELQLPDEFSADQVGGLLRHVAALRQGPVMFRTASSAGRLRFYAGGTVPALEAVAGALAGLHPGMRLIEVAGSDLRNADGKAAIAAFCIGWDGTWPLLRTTDPELAAAALLGILASVRPPDEMELLVRLGPVGRINRPLANSERRAAQVNPWLMRGLWPAQPPREDVPAIRAKFSDLVLRAELIVVARASNPDAAEAYAQRLIAGLRVSGGRRGVLRYRRVMGRGRISRLLERSTPPLPWQISSSLSPEELVGITGLPVEAPQVAGISYGVGPRLMPPLDMPTTGRVLARSTWPAAEGQLLAQPVIGGLQHTAIVGPTGSGKSTAVIRLVEQDMAAGRGAFVLDLKGDLVSDLLNRVPSHREKDVIVLEPARGGRQPGLQLFSEASVDAELTSDLVLGTLRGLFIESWGVRSSQYLGLGLKTLAAVPGCTLVELAALFTDAQYRGRALKQVHDPWLHQAWQRFLSLSPAEQATHIASPLTKLEELTGRARLRLVLGQSASQLNFNDVLRQGRIVLVSLPPGLLGMPATRLLAALTLWQFFQAVEGRAGVTANRRHPFMAYIDEVSVLSDLPLPIESILERARGHGVGLTLSPQALSQLDQGLRNALLANVNSLVAFAQTSAKEADVLAANLPGVTGSQLQHLGKYEVAMRLGLGPGQITPTMTGTALPPGEPCNSADHVRELSGQRFGQTIEAVDAELKQRLGYDAQPGPGSDAKPENGLVGGALGVTQRRR